MKRSFKGYRVGRNVRPPSTQEAARDHVRPGNALPGTGVGGQRFRMQRRQDGTADTASTGAGGGSGGASDALETGAAAPADPGSVTFNPVRWWDATKRVVTDESDDVLFWTDVIADDIAVPRSVSPAYDAAGGFIYIPDEAVAANHQKLIANQDGAATQDYRFLVDGSGDGVTVWLRLRFRLGTASADYVAGLDDFGSSTLYFNRNSASVIQAVHQGASGFTAVTANGITADTVHNIFVTIDPSTAGTPQLSIYLDSATPAQSANINNFYEAAAPLPNWGIGGTGDTGNENTAEADFFQVALYDKVLTTEQIQSLIDFTPTP